MESLASLNLIRLESQFQRSQSQFRKFIFKSLFLWNESQYHNLYQSAPTAITKYHRISGLSNTNQFSHRSKCQLGCFLVNPLSFSFRCLFLGLSSLGLVSVYVHFYLLLFLKGQQSYRLRDPPLWPNLTFITSFKTISLNTVTLGLNKRLVGGHFQSITHLQGTNVL